MSAISEDERQVLEAIGRAPDHPFFCRFIQTLGTNPVDMYELSRKGLVERVSASDDRWKLTAAGAAIVGDREGV